MILSPGARGFEAAESRDLRWRSLEASEFANWGAIRRWDWSAARLSTAGFLVMCGVIRELALQWMDSRSCTLFLLQIGREAPAKDFLSIRWKAGMDDPEALHGGFVCMCWCGWYDSSVHVR
jgi:hypothetical protein